MSKQFKLENKDTIITSFDALKPKPKVLYTASEIAKIYRAKISLAIKNGYSFKEIVVVFNNHECSISAKELELAFVRLKGSKKPEQNNSVLKNSINQSTIKTDVTLNKQES